MNIIYAYNINSSTCPTSSIPPPLPPDPRSSTPPQVHLHPLQHHHRRQHHRQHHRHHPHHGHHHHDGFNSHRLHDNVIDSLKKWASIFNQVTKIVLSDLRTSGVLISVIKLIRKAPSSTHQKQESSISSTYSEASQGCFTR